VPETTFCCLKICGWNSSWATICQIPGVLQYPDLVHVYERQIPDPRELSIGQIPGGVPGGGWLLQELTHALQRLEKQKC
jgi:hypothetical protein